MKFAVFSIDNQDREHRRALFDQVCERHNLSVKPCIGKYKDEIEFSYISTVETFNKIWLGTEFVANQESVLLVSENNNQAATLWYLATGEQRVVGHLRYCSKWLAEQAEGYTFRPDLNQYWTIQVTDDEKKREAVVNAIKALDHLWWDHEAAQGLRKAFGIADPRRSKKVDFEMRPIPGSTAFTITAPGRM